MVTSTGPATPIGGVEMVQLLSPLAQRLGDRVAIIDDAGTTSWVDLNARVNRLVRALRDRGLRDGDVVAILAANQRELFEMYLACTHGGWRFVPVNWHCTADELAYVLGDSGARALLTDGDLSAVAAEATAAAPVPVRVAVSGGDSFEDYETLLAAADAREPADQRIGQGMFYTSGTTGRPKGVRFGPDMSGVEPVAVAAHASAFCTQRGLPLDGVSLLCGPAYHGAQWTHAMYPLLAGSTLVVHRSFDAATVLAAIDVHRVTNVHLVPTQFVRLLRLPDEIRREFDGSSLRRVVHGGAPCPPEVKRQMIDWFGPIVLEYYGGSEVGVVSFITSDEWLARPGSVGRPIDSVEVLVLDDDGVSNPPGHPGQLWFRNHLGIDFEYHNDREKTASAHREPGVSTLGDIGYLDEDGWLFLTDRASDMIISGGVNIYPAEIEAVLIAHPGVVDVAVFGVPDDEYGERVRAAVELNPDWAPGPATTTELRAWCRERLAGYKCPSAVDYHATLPRLDTGKLAKHTLREPYWEETGRQI